MKKLLLAGALSAAAVTTGIAAPAAADPSHFAVPVEVECDNGQDYTAVFRGGAYWNVLLVSGSNAVLVPTRQQVGLEVLDADGNVLFEFHDPVIEKGRSVGRPPNQTVCSIDFTVPQPDGTTVHGYGTTTFFVTPGS